MKGCYDYHHINRANCAFGPPRITSTPGDLTMIGTILVASCVHKWRPSLRSPRHNVGNVGNVVPLAGD